MTQDLNQQLYQHLEELKIIDPKILKECYTLAVSSHRDLSDIIYQKDLLTDEQLGQILSDIYNLPFVQLKQQELSLVPSEILPEIFCRHQQLIVFKKDNLSLYLATSTPNVQQATDFVSRKTGLAIKLFYATSRDINSFIDTHYGNTALSFETAVANNVKEAQLSTSKDHPVATLAELILIHAHKNYASDVHLEPQKNQTVIRFRIDGILHDIYSIPKDIYDQLVTRLKVMSSLRTDVHQSAQDGKLQQLIDEEDVDIRISITPTIDGEKIVMRLLSSKSRQFSLTNLGFSESDLAKLTSAYKKPYGMVLSTGPTGSGKTTTLYAILKLVNTRDVNIMTIEDPVEYEIEGINQIQVNLQTNLTFADGLRSIVRQDPNIILVGEIRDQETSQIAINAAMTGHLVLSTLHTNDAATTIPRLFDMGVEPFLVASSINAIIAQRLVRQICIKCRATKEVTLKELVDSGLPKELFPKKSTKKTLRIYQGQGCSVCHNTGYNGRIGIFELMIIDDKLRTAITKRSSASEITKLAVSQGMTTMLQDGINKIFQGLTTVDEILRVTKI